MAGVVRHGLHDVDRALGVLKQRSTASARTAKVVMSQTMRLAARHGAVAYNPVREVAGIDSEPTKPPRSLPAEERQQWLDAVEASDKGVDWDLRDPDADDAGCRLPGR